MHGLINRSIQCFVRNTYGPDTWSRVCARAELGFENFEAMLTYDDAQTEAVLAAIAALLGRGRRETLEDVGHYLVSNSEIGPVRRLLRFGGETFIEFLHSLEDIHERARLALPGLDCPQFRLRTHSPGCYTLALRWHAPDMGALVLGMLRAMADDYGALAVFDYAPPAGARAPETITVELLDCGFAAGRTFELGKAAG